ncbi:hypothetical protein [Burkholderia lata]|uniref:hypothetical protein n=1 Tax=Burkholderia lata (strain ATCC 17760 / DSM 23089 / LMG 22485 / NCIMB 9086 / R18194 / 383) TaxID=482957 RepID=UPI0020C5CBC5|nr:hypothetical protein [Burkholderia lata]
MCHLRDVLRHSTFRCFHMSCRGHTFRRIEPVQRGLPPGGHIVRDIDRRIGLHARFVARRSRCALARLEHRIAEQVERPFVPRRVGRRTAGPCCRPR